MVSGLKSLGIDLTLAPSVIDIFDTEFLGYEVFGRDFKCCLKRVIKTLRLRGENFHNAGNDAGYTLRVMFLLAVWEYDGLMLGEMERERVDGWRKVAKF